MQPAGVSKSLTRSDVGVGDIFDEVFQRIEALELSSPLTRPEVVKYLDRIASSLESMDALMRALADRESLSEKSPKPEQPPAQPSER